MIPEKESNKKALVSSMIVDNYVPGEIFTEFESSRPARKSFGGGNDDKDLSFDRRSSIYKKKLDKKVFRFRGSKEESLLSGTPLAKKQSLRK
jgi:hypothetical protein